MARFVKHASSYVQSFRHVFIFTDIIGLRLSQNGYALSLCAAGVPSFKYVRRTVAHF